MGRRSSKGRLGARVDAAFETVGLTILPGVDMPQWAQALADEPAPQVHRPIADQEPSAQPEPAARGDLAEQGQVPGQWTAQPPTAAGQAHPAQAMAGAGALVGAAAGARTLPSGPSGTGADPSMPGVPPAAGDGRSEQSWGSAHDAAHGHGTAPQEFSEEQVALLSWWADTIASGNQPPVPAQSAYALPAARERRRIPPWALIAVGLALVALAAGVVLGPRLWGAAAEPAVEPVQSVSVPSSLDGLVAITDAAVADEMRPLIGFGLRPSGLIVTRPYGVDEAGPLSLATMATTMGAPGDTASQIEAWSQRTGSTVAAAVTGSGTSADVTCAAAVGTETVPTGAFCVWTGADGLRGQTYAVDLSAKKALQLTAEVRAGTSL